MKKIEIGQKKLSLNKQTIANLSTGASSPGAIITLVQTEPCIASFYIPKCGGGGTARPDPPTACMSGTPFSCA